MSQYIHQHPDWPNFMWEHEPVVPLLSKVRHKQGRLKGYLEALGFALRNETSLQSLTMEVTKSSEIENEFLDAGQVRSSIARQLGMNVAGLVPASRNVDGVVAMMLDATRNTDEPLDKYRLCSWHADLFPAGKKGINKMIIGDWRDNKKGPMQVVSGVMGKEHVHFEAPEADRLEQEMNLFLKWFAEDNVTDPVLKSAIAHVYFVTIHPFSDGNGRIARAIADMQLAKSDGDHQRFYSMSAQIRLERNAYYAILEKTQKGSLDVTEWLLWYLDCLDRALDVTDETLKHVLNKTKFWDEHHGISINERQRLLINKLFDGFVGKLTSSKWAKIAKCSADTALRDINDLMEKGVLKKDGGGGRSTGYVLKEEELKIKT